MSDERSRTPREIHKELQSWDKLTDDPDYDQGYVLGFRMALKWALGMESTPDSEVQHGH